MKKMSLSIGLSLVAMATVLSACDKNRPANTMADNKKIKRLCASPRGLNLNAINENRAAQLADKSQARVIMVKSSAMGFKTSTYEAKDSNESNANSVSLERIDCESNPAVKVNFPGDKFSSVPGRIVSLDTQKIVIHREAIDEKAKLINEEVNQDKVQWSHSQTITITVSGLDKGVKMEDLKNEDGLNRITVNVVDEMTPKIIAEENPNKNKLDEGAKKLIEKKTQSTQVISESVAVENNDSEFDVVSDALVDANIAIESGSIGKEPKERISSLVKSLAKPEGVKNPVLQFADEKNQTLVVPAGAIVKMRLSDIKAVTEIVGSAQE